MNTMVKLYSKTLDELREEMLTKKLEIARESVISTLIGLEQGLDEIKLEVRMEHDFVTLSLSVRMEDFVDTFNKNKEALIELEEYELLQEIQKHLGQMNKIIKAWSNFLNWIQKKRRKSVWDL